MKNVFLPLVLLFGGCQQQTEKEIKLKYPYPVVDFGYIVYGDLHNNQMYFVPVKEKKISITGQGFKSENLNIGFLFYASSKIQNELSMLERFEITNQLKDKKLSKYMGHSFYTPVRIVYEIDPNEPDVLVREGYVDTVSLGQGRYSKNGEKITFAVHFPGADVLEIGGIDR